MNKGFTLVELLAVIVLLSILSGVVLFSLGSTLINSKEKLTDHQITTIEKAAQSYYLKEGINDNNNKACITLDVLIDNGYIDDNKIIDFVENNEMNGHVQIAYKANQYSYKYKDGECPIPACKVITGDGTNVGDEIECGGEQFYVIENDEKIISMLAKYNLNVGDNAYTDGTLGIQNENVKGYKDGMTSYGGTKFSETMYWTDESYIPAGDSLYKSIFDNNSNLYTYVKSYQEYLRENGVRSAVATLISYEQLVLLGCNKTTYACSSVVSGIKKDGVAPNWVYSTTYWSGSASYSAYIWSVWTDGRFRDEVAYVATSVGIRPVVNISVDEL